MWNTLYTIFGTEFSAYRPSINLVFFELPSLPLQHAKIAISLASYSLFLTNGGLETVGNLEPWKKLVNAITIDILDITKKIW
jgi:hypothetical protein